MKYLQFTTLYPKMLENLYKKHKEKLLNLNTIQKLIQNEYLESHRWPYYLPKNEFEIKNYIVNDFFSQNIWCLENGIKIKSIKNWYFETIFHQIMIYKPDIIFFSSEAILKRDEIKFIKENFKFVKKIIIWVGVLNSTKNSKTFKYADEIFTSSLDIHNHFSPEKKVKQIHLAFDDNILKQVKNVEKKNQILFLGNIFLERNLHGHRAAILKEISKHCNLKIYSNLNDYKLKNFVKNFFFKLLKISNYKDFNALEELKFYTNMISLKKINYSENLYGLDQFRKLNENQIVLNIHQDNINFAANVRLFESTGMGCCLFTEAHKNLSQLFTEDKEIVTFKNKYDLIEKIGYYKNHYNEAKKIGKNAQIKIFKLHTFNKRIVEFKYKLLEKL